MTISVTHPFVSAIADDPAAGAAGEVLPSHWNAAHVITGGTSGSVLFIDGSSNLAQDNANFSWDDTNHDLHIGNSYFIGSSRAIFTIPNVSGNNWFEGAAGNTTVTGYGNFGAGDNALSAITTGFHNVAIGAQAGLHLLDGYQNFGMGANALNRCQSDAYNVAIGTNTLYFLGNAGAGGGNNVGNVAIGYGSLGNMEVGVGNVAIGFNVLSNVVPPYTASFNLVIGNQAGAVLGTSSSISSNIFIGGSAGYNITGGNSNTWIGGYQGLSGAVGRTIAFSDGEAINLLDMNITTFGVWSMNYNISNAQPIGLHIYNYQDAHASTANYERAVIDWNIAANVLAIGTQKAGTGSTRNMEFIIGGTNKLDFGVTNAGLWTFAQATMFATSVALTDGTAAQAATLTNGPAAGNPTKWVPINDNGTTRFIPAW